MGLIKAKSNGLDLSSHTHSVMNSAYIINDMGGFGLDKQILKYASILHDLGKANPLFQSNMETNNFDKVCRHEISSILFINAVPEKIRHEVAYIVLSHHKSLDGDERSILEMYNQRPKELYKNHIGNIEEWGLEVKNFLSEYYNIEINVPTYDECVNIIDTYAKGVEKIENGWSKYRGVFVMADHFASCYDNDKVRINLSKNLFKPVNTDFYSSKNEKYPLSLIESNKSKKHTFLIAPTGCGKTNFVLKRCDNHRIFYTLPFQASINAMYKRIEHDININNNYLMGIKHASMSTISFIDDTSKELSNLFGLSVKVLTPFQMMSALIGTKGYETVLMDVIGQDVILDEIHTYGGVGLYAVVELVKLLVWLGCNVHICTATIPTKFANEIVKILGEEDTQVVKLDANILDTFNRHIIHTVKEINYDDVIKRYKNGEKVLVVRNTVKSAKDTYIELKNKVPSGTKLLLLHSRFERKRKSEIEETLMAEFNAKKEPCIVVSTQVVEVSLDINFDVMFTDCADIMSLIQRFGRVNRQRENIGIMKDIYVAEWYNPQGVRNQIYPDYICKKTYNELSKYDGKVLPERDIQGIIDSVHDNFELIKAERFSPFLNGEWKQKMYCNNVNTSLANALEIVGYVGILQSKIQYYLKTNDKSVEIPIIGRKDTRDDSLYANKIKFSPYRDREEGKVQFYIIPDNLYSNEMGL